MRSSNEAVAGEIFLQMLNVKCSKVCSNVNSLSLLKWVGLRCWFFIPNNFFYAKYSPLSCWGPLCWYGGYLKSFNWVYVNPGSQIDQRCRGIDIYIGLWCIKILSDPVTVIQRSHCLVTRLMWPGQFSIEPALILRLTGTSRIRYVVSCLSVFFYIWHQFFESTNIAYYQSKSKMIQNYKRTEQFIFL